MTPERRRAVRYCGISPFFSVTKREGSKGLFSVCRRTDFLERLTRSGAITQNDLIDHVAALNTAPGPMSPLHLTEIRIHAMVLNKHAPAPPARNRPEGRVRERSLRGSGFRFPNDARDASDRNPHDPLLFFSGSVVSLLAQLVDVTDAALESASKHPSGMLEKTLGRTVDERNFLSFLDQ